MNGWSLLGICVLAWLTWVPAVLLEKTARGDTRSTSILPVIPCSP